MKKNDWLFLLLIIALALFSLSFFVVDPDYLWHVKAGEYMFHHGLLTKDVFSWSVASKYWMSHEWLFEIIIYGLKRVFGSYHLFIYCFSMMFLLFLTIYIANREELQKNLLFSIIWFGCSFIVGVAVQGRPQMISNLFLALSIYFLYDLFKNENSRKIYFLPIITILWANIHGGSSNLPYLLCLLFIVAGVFKFRFSKVEAKRITKKQFFKYLCVMILCMVCVCINLHGFKMFLYPYENMLDSTMLQNISEWQSTSLNVPSHYFYFLLLILITGIFLFSKKKINFTDLMLFGFCTFLGLKRIRFWTYTYIMMSFIVFPYIPKSESYIETRIGLVIISCISIILFSFRTDHILHPSYHYVLTKKDIQAVEKVKPKKLFNMYDFGGDLIYNDIKVFVDGRADLYGKYNFKDYLIVASLQQGYLSIMKDYDFDYYLVDQKYPISYYLMTEDEYDLVYKNKTVYLYKKRTMES